MRILAVQPPWPKTQKLTDPTKYIALPLLKLCSYFKSIGHEVAMITAEGIRRTEDSNSLFLTSEVPFKPDLILFSSIFSYWFNRYLRPTVMRYHQEFPDAQILVGGPHVSTFPEVYKKSFPFAKLHIGKFEAAEKVPIDYAFLKYKPRTQIVSFSQGCPRKCKNCIAAFSPYETYTFDQIAPQINLNRLILNDMSLVAHKHVEDILKRLATFRVNGRTISSVELQGGLDCRILANKLHLVTLLKAARFTEIRIAWDQGLDMRPAVEKCLEALEKVGYNPRNIRCYVLTNYDCTFETVIKKLKYLEQYRVGPIASRYRPLNILEDNYVPQKHSGQSDKEYYVHTPAGWSDAKIRLAGSIARDTAQMVRTEKPNVDVVRAFLGKPSVAESLARVA